MPAHPPSPVRHRDPLHGMTLEALVAALVAQYGWDGLGKRIPVRCFTSQPSLASSLKFLRKTPWARDKVEGLYLFMLRDARRVGGTSPAAGSQLSNRQGEPLQGPQHPGEAEKPAAER